MIIFGECVREISKIYVFATAYQLLSKCKMIRLILNCSPK